jgi:transcriptional regulator with XRE-family HTH domain
MVELQEQEAWTEADRRAMREARRRRHHTQSQLAAALAELGYPGANQASVSEWETGRTREPVLEAQLAIRKYVAATIDDAGDQWSDIVNAITRVPGLTDDQRSFLDIVAARVSTGPPLSDNDLVVLSNLARTYGLEWRMPRG